MSHSSCIFLVGLMGSGKTTLGKKIADAMNYQFIDTDEDIEKKEQKNINSIFKNEGENHFRKLEKEILAQIPKEKIIIATGGGLPCYHENMKYMNQYGKTIWLNVPIPILVERLWNQTNKRPLIANCKDEIDLYHKLNYVYQKRVFFYNQSKIILTQNNLQLEDILRVLD